MDKKISSFALFCLTINCIIIKIFIGAPVSILKSADANTVSALWLSALIGISAICVIYSLRHCISKLILNRGLYKILLCAVFAYFVCITVYLLYEAVNVIHSTIYHNMPLILILIIIALTALYIGTRNSYSLARVHGICVPIIILGIIAASLSGLKYIDPLNAAPILQGGITSILCISLKHLVSFADVILPVLLILYTANKPTLSGKSPSFVILVSAVIGILFYTTIMTVFFLTLPTSAIDEATLPIGHLSKFSAGGRLGVRCDALYALVMIESSILFIGAALHLAITAIKKIGFSIGKRSRYAALLAVMLMSAFTLCGCYDSREVEDTAFAIAIGIDPGGVEGTDDTTSENSAEAKAYSYTFQFSNPLATGENTNTDTASSSSSEGDDSEEGNKTVDNIKVEADNIYEALNRVTNYMGKTPSLAHLKLLVLSDKLTNSGDAQQLCSDLLKIDDIRPETSVCTVMELTAVQYLTSVKPSLEDSTARHYELMFDKDSTFDSIQIDLRTFTLKLKDKYADAYAPIVNDTGFNGTMLFSEGVSAADISAEDSRIMNLLLGNVKAPTLFYTDKNNRTYRLRQSSRPKIETSISDNMEVSATIKLTISAESVNGDDIPADTASSILQHELSDKTGGLLNFIYSRGSDILEIGKNALFNNPMASVDGLVPKVSYRVTPNINIMILNNNQ